MPSLIATTFVRQLARVLARKLDLARGSHAAAMAAAVAQLARELRGLVELLATDDEGDRELVASLFADFAGSALDGAAGL